MLLNVFMSYFVLRDNQKNLLDRAGGFHKTLRYMEDYFMFSKFSVLADLYYIDANFYMWRRHPDGLTGSPARLSMRGLEAYQALRREPLLYNFRREARWAYYNAAKGLALNNLLSGYWGRALGFAVRAYAADPREIGDFLRFLRLMCLRNIDRIASESWSYSRAERFIHKRPT